MPKTAADTVREAMDAFFLRHPVPSNEKVLVALSGGSDSVALLFASIRHFGAKRVAAAHFDHSLRGADSLADAEFCRNLCEKTEIGFELGTGDVAAAAKAKKTGTEDAARTLRYEFLKKAAENAGASRILTGHTADDLAETVLANFFRGSKARGWSGIPESAPGGVLRPLLRIRKKTLLAFLEELGQDFRHDASNLDPAYLRNRIRHRIIPEIETFNEGFVTTARKFAEYARELDEYLDAEVAKFLDSQECPKTFDIAEFESLPEFLRKEILSRLYVRANDGGIGLSEGMVEEMLRFCSLRYGGKSKTFGKLELSRKKGTVSYEKNREA